MTVGGGSQAIRLSALALEAGMVGLLLVACSPSGVDPSSPARLDPAELRAAVAPACRGEPVVGAGEYPSDGRPHRVAFVVTLDDDSPAEIPPEDAYDHGEMSQLAARSVAATQLVACIGEKTTVWEVCRYLGSFPITRVGYEVDVSLYAASTAELVDVRHFSSGAPPACPARVRRGHVEYLGDRPYDVIMVWLGTIVQPPGSPAGGNR